MTNGDFLKKMGIELKVARIKKGLTRNQVAEKTGLYKNTIYVVESGKKDCKILSYKRMADALEVDLKNLL
jgi:DNA-binding XRE family transcriptional regulator